MHMLCFQIKTILGSFSICSEGRLVSSVSVWTQEEPEACVQSQGYAVTGAMGTLVGTGSLKGMRSKNRKESCALWKGRT